MLSFVPTRKAVFDRYQLRAKKAGTRVLIRRHCLSAAVTSLFLCSGMAFLFPIQGQGVESQSHSIAAITVHPDGLVFLGLKGKAPSSAHRFFDLYPIELSSDLNTWTWLGFSTRTND